MKNSAYYNFLVLNFGLLMISTSGVLGRTLQMAPELSIFYRCVLSAILLGTFIAIKKYGLGIKEEGHKKYILIGGILMAIHWITYFYALSLSTIAIAILTLHMFPAMTAILEPLLLGTKFKVYHLALATLVIIGIYIISPPIDLSNNIFKAVLFGTLSALTYALRNIYTRKIMKHYNGSVMMFYQLCIMMVLLLPYLFLKSSQPLITHDWPFIIGLAVLTTCLGHTLLVQSLKNYSAVTISLMSSIIPIYGVFLGYIFLAEMPAKSTLIGGTFILTSFVIEGYHANKR